MKTKMSRSFYALYYPNKILVRWFRVTLLFWAIYGLYVATQQYGELATFLLFAITILYAQMFTMIGDSFLGRL